MADRKVLIGMIHVGALPGTPNAAQAIEALEATAVREALALRDAGFDAVMVENMHDAPYMHGAQGPEIVASMTRIALAVKEVVPDLALGVQVLSGGAKDALAIALAANAQFIRVENFVFAHIADEGLLDKAEAGPLLRYRKAIGAGKIEIYADIKKKHASHAITADVPLAQMVEGAMFFGADGVIISGVSTGKAADVADVQAAKAVSTKPVLVGSGATKANARELLRHADGIIVGSSIKVDGVWTGGVDAARAEEFVKAARA